MSDPDAVCIFEDALARSDDPWISCRDTRILTFNDEVYHFLSQNDIAEQIVKTIRRATTAWQTVGLMTYLKPHNRIKDGLEIGVDELQVFADRASKIVVGAYDGEGYLIWGK